MHMRGRSKNATVLPSLTIGIYTLFKEDSATSAVELLGRLDGSPSITITLQDLFEGYYAVRATISWDTSETIRSPLPEP